MSTAFASSQARLGESTVRRLANASAVVVATAASFDVIFTRRPTDAALGDAGFTGRRVYAVSSVTDANANALEQDVQLVIDGETWKIDLRTDDEDLGQATLDLSLA
jgi:hypothetical protein